MKMVIFFMKISLGTDKACIIWYLIMEKTREGSQGSHFFNIVATSTFAFSCVPSVLLKVHKNATQALL